MNLDNQPTPRAPVRRFAFLAIVAALAAMPFGTAAADPGARNRIDGVASSARGEETSIRMRGSRTPTFTMYKLDRPARLVVDVSSAELADSLRGEDAATFSVNTWAVQQVTAHETGEGSRRGVRLVVSLARPSTYDVKVDGRDLVVRVKARERAPVTSSPVSAAASAAAASEKAAAARAMSDAKRMMDEATSLKRQAEETAAQARRDVAAAKADAERARTDARARDEQAKARLADAASMKKEAAAELAAANQAKSAAAAEEKRARERATAARGAEATAAQRRDEARVAAAEAERARTAADQAARAKQDGAAALERTARAAAAHAEKRRIAAETAEAESARRADESRRATAAAEARRAEVTQALEVAEAGKRRAESERAAAEEARRRAEAARKSAEAQAAQAVARANASERTASEAAKRADAARAVRLAEEQALAKAETARRDAESRRGQAERAKSALEAEMTAVRAAETQAAERRRAAEGAEREARLAERERRSQQEIDRARGEAKRLQAERASAEKELADRRGAAEAQRKSLAELGRERDRAAAELGSLEKAAEAAARRRADEEKKVAVLSAQRASAEQALAVARTQREKLAAELVAARAAAEKDRAAAEQQRIAAERQRVAAEQELASERAAAERELAATRAAAAKDRQTAEQQRVAAEQQRRAAEREVAATRTAAEREVAATRTAAEREVAATRTAAEQERASAEKMRLAAAKERQAAEKDRAAAVSARRETEAARAETTKARAEAERLRAEAERLRASVKQAKAQPAPAPAPAPAAPPAAAPRRSGTTATDVPSPVMASGNYGSSSGVITQQSVSQVRGRKKVYRGRKIDLDFKDADIHNLLRLLSDVGGVSIIVPDDVKASITVRMRDVPWDQAMEVILSSKGLWYRREGRLIRIAPRKELEAEDEAEAARIRAMVEQEAPEPEIFTLDYTDAKQAEQQLAPLLSPKGSIEVDQRTNSIIVNDIRAHRRRIIDLISRLDTQTPQIQIEARIVEARTTFLREFGIQWGGNMNMSAAGGNATGLIFPNSVGVAGGAEDSRTPNAGVVTPSDFAVNLPAAVGTGSGGAIGMSLGSVGGNFNLNLRLSALEDTGSVRIISAPKITTSNNIEASIKSGVSIPISVISANGVQTQFVPADLQLRVTPAVSQRDCSVSMAVNVTKNEADFVNTGARGDPSILTKEATTTILVEDGQTAVIGGIYTRNTGVSYSKVPFFGDIPVLGWFFKSRRENDERSEVLVFITPKITNRAFLRCQ